MDPKHLDDLARTLMDSLPRGIQSLQADAQNNLRSALQASLQRMNLVSREAFDVQADVLRRSREKLELLEQRIGELEQLIARRLD
jgi:BMFP domain-containing protein YqiC